MTQKSFPISRRSSLLLLGTGVCAAAFGANGARAQGMPVAPGADLFEDGHLDLTVGFVFPTAPDAERSAALGSPEAALALPCTVPLLRLDDRMILFDAGAGPNFMVNAGHLSAALDAAGVDVAAITDIIFTHGHPDHLWGIADEFDEPTFPNARYHMSRTERDFWADPDTVSQMPDDTKPFAVGASARLALIADRVETFDDGAEILPGIEAMATPGHTPGHSSFVLHPTAGNEICGTGDGRLLITGDVISHPLSVAHPGWRWGTDQDADRAVATRQRLLDRMANEKLHALVYHMPPGQPGHVEGTADGGLRWVPGS